MSSNELLQKVDNYKHFEDLTAHARAEAGLKNINCFLSPDQIDSFARQRVLSYFRDDMSLILFHDHDAYFQLYLFLDAADPQFRIDRLDKDAVTDFPGMNRTLNTKYQRAIEELRKAGFAHNATSVKMIKELIEPTEIDLSPAGGLQLQVAEPRHMHKIYELWGSGLDAASNALPSIADLERHIEEGSIVIGVVDDALVGAIQVESKIDGSCFLRHLVVSDAYKGRSVGSTLMRQAPYYSIEPVPRSAYHWVQTTNVPALAMFEKIGYGFDGRYLEQYILKAYEGDQLLHKHQQNA